MSRALHRCQAISGTNLIQQSVALREAIKEYDTNKWKAIGQKLGKPAKVIIPYRDWNYYSN